MKKLVSIILFAAPLFAAYPTPPGHPPNGWPDEARRYSPWSDKKFIYCVQQWSFGAGGQESIGANSVQVQMFLTPIATTGYHGHSGGTRPAPTLVGYDHHDSLGRPATDVTGCITVTYRGPGYSGWYLLLIVPGQQAPCGCQVSPQSWPQEGHNIYMGALDFSAPQPHGSEPFTPLIEFNQLTQGSADLTMPITNHNDSRHSNRSRAATSSTIQKLAMLAFEYQVSSLRQALTPVQPLDIIRASLPDGGIADNEQTYLAGTGIYVGAEWTSRAAEEHYLGNEVDVVNPANVSSHGAFAYNAFDKLARYVGCMGYYTPDGAGISQPFGPTGYWASQSVVHLACNISPIGILGYH